MRATACYTYARPVKWLQQHPLDTGLMEILLIDPCPHPTNNMFAFVSDTTTYFI